jgi:DNA-binding transcriptional LysR family regulator
MDFEGLRAIIAVAEEGSIAAAARKTGLSRATLRRRLQALATHLDAELMVSDGRDITLTPVGHVAVEHARTVLDGADELTSAVHCAAHQVGGSLCVLVPISLHATAAFISYRAARNHLPRIGVEVRVVADPLAELDRTGDLALHWGELPQVGARIARRLRSVPLRLLASTAYVEDHGLPQTLEELASHDLLLVDDLGLSPRELPLLAGGGVEVEPAYVSNHLVFVDEMTRMGQGIGLVPHAALPGLSWPQDAVPVLPDLVGRDVPNWVVGRESLSGRPSVAGLLEEIAVIMGAVRLAP